ncbi:C50 peptidase [Helicosporidium sp. ATCC 50920]|nr:C50 peptidase [Helicosporidium sp. ATCC 50920]|eukprot:KDD77102.1 C50 peptidase [Helicosporidium sp. ATCC 50920]
MPSLALALHAARQPAQKDRAPVLGDRTNLTKDAMQPPSPPMLNPLDAYYLLNPSGDLEGTQARFEARFGAYKSWEGVVGAPPPAQELARALEGRQLFVYMGHGGGEQYLAPSRLRQLRCRAGAMLMGCSSGRLWTRPEEPSLVGGGLLAYMVAGCPGTVANLWDVTDKDIDRFAEACLDVWMDGRGRRGGTAAVAREARSACRLKHLNGLAPVCYGLPMRVEGRVRE